MDLNELASRTGLPVRKLRYVFDHRVVPGLAGCFSGHGVPRTFTEFEGFGVALAARLLDAGLTRKVVLAGLTAACRPGRSTDTRTDVPLLRAYTVAAGRLEIGDGRYLRVCAPGRPGLGRALDTGWLPLVPSAPISGECVPVVVVSIELEGLAQAVQDQRSDAGRW